MNKRAVISIAHADPSAFAEDAPRAARGLLGLGVTETYDRIDDRRALRADLGRVADSELEFEPASRPNTGRAGTSGGRLAAGRSGRSTPRSHGVGRAWAGDRPGMSDQAAPIRRERRDR
jgi:hypothetical protein